MTISEQCTKSYERLKNLKLVGEELNIPWQTVYVHLKRSGVKVTGDKARYGSATDRVAIIGENRFRDTVPIAIDNNKLQYQSTVDFTVGNVKVDIKTARIRRYQDARTAKNTAPRWGFCINKQLDIADFFVFYALDENDQVKHVFLMPHEIVTTCSTISIPESLASKWADYKVNESDLLPFFRAISENA